MPRSQGGPGRGRGRSASRAQVAAPTGTLPPFQPIPFNPNSSSTLERLASAAAMIETSGAPTDTLLEHQGHQRSSQLPSQERLRPYSIPSSRTTSRHTSRASASVFDADERPDRARRSSKSELRATDMRFYSDNDQKNIKHARKLIVLDMVLESGWKKTSELNGVASECILQASAVSGHVTQSTDAINKLIFDGLSTIRGKLVNETERIISALDLYPPPDCGLSDNEKDA
ncbi:hypothetical protein CY34DRAFT_111336, partial [Suillus luteus UH-Slu-Lm8-n1]